MSATMVYASGFETPTELVSFMFESGVELSEIRMERGPDNLWRGSGSIKKYAKDDE